MRVLLVSSYYPPQAAIASTRVHAHAEAWAASGAEVTVLTTVKRPDQRSAPRPSDGARVVEVGYQTPAPLRWLRAYAGRKGVRAGAETRPAACREAPARGPAAVLKSLRERTGVLATTRMPDLTHAWIGPAVREGVRLAADRPFDVVVASSGPYTSLLVGERLKALGAARAFVAEFRDLWTGNHTASGLWPFTVFERALERRVLRAADRVVTVSPPLAEWLARRTDAPVDVVPNGHDGRRPAGEPIHPGQTSLVYTGTLYPRGQDTSPLLAAAALFRERDPASASRLRFVIAGGSCGAWAEAARAHGVLDMLDLRGAVPIEESLRLQDGASALLSIEWADPGKGVVTAKVSEYIAAQAPVFVVGPRGPVCELVESCGRGRYAGMDAPGVHDSLGSLVSGSFDEGIAEDACAVEGYSRGAQAVRMLELMRASSEAAG